MNELVEPTQEIQIKKPLLIWIGYFFSFFSLSILAFYALNSINLSPSFTTENKHKFTVFSGDSSGVYFDIANRLDNKYYTNERTNGSNDNCRKIASNDYSFGFTQKDDLENLNENILPIVKLYTERLHIIYRKKSKKYKICHPENITLVPSPDSCLKVLLQSATICAGAKKSSTQFMTRLILKNIKGVEVDTIISDNLSSALKKLDSDEYQILFYTAGFLDEFKVRLEKTTEFGLASIDKSILNELEYRYGKESITDFSDINNDYPIESRSAATIEVPAMLVCNKNINKEEQEKLLLELDKIKDKVPALRGQNFLAKFAETKKVKDSAFIKWFIFSSVLFLIGYLHRYLFLISKSRYYQGNLFSFINAHVIDGLPKNYKFKKWVTNTEYLEPDIHSTQIPIINKITVGISNGLVARDSINEYYSKKYLLNSHYSFLMNRNDMIIKKLRKVLTRRLNHVLIREENPEKESIFTKKLLSEYLTYEYITQSDFKWLIKIWEKTEFYRIDRIYIGQLIAKDEIYNALDSLRIVLENYKDEEKNDIVSEFSNEVDHQLSRYSAIMKEKNLDTLYHRDFDTTMNRLKQSIAELADRMVTENILLKNKSVG